jgi:hypothetical protein
MFPVRFFLAFVLALRGNTGWFCLGGFFTMNCTANTVLGAQPIWGHEQPCWHHGSRLSTRELFVLAFS